MEESVNEKNVNVSEHHFYITLLGKQEMVVDSEFEKIIVNKFSEFWEPISLAFFVHE